MNDTEAVYIYRIETPNGDGMYSEYGPNKVDGLYISFRTAVRIGTDHKVDSFALDKTIHPSPHTDCAKLDHFFTFSTEEVRFGFGSVKQMEDWTINKDVRAVLDAAGFVLAVYTVSGTNNYCIGRKQAAYKTPYATCVFKVGLEKYKEVLSEKNLFK